MIELNNTSGSSPGDSRNGPANGPLKTVQRRVAAFLSSVKLAIVLLITILACCFVGAAVLPQDEAATLIFDSLWFNGVLVLLVLNVAVCFFGRIRGRKITLVSFGMILFHLSFVAMLAGIVYNSLFYFRGEIRLTEGETLPSGQSASYDRAEHGRFFSYDWLKGRTSLIKVRRHYRVGNEEKRWAYQIAVGEGRFQKQGTIYVTNSLTQNGFTYYNGKEGYSILVLLYDNHRKELYGAHVPLQSLRQEDKTYVYTTGTSVAPGALAFPHEPEKPEFLLQVIYHPSEDDERGGDVTFKVWPISASHEEQPGKALAEKKGPVGRLLNVGDYYLSAREVRYWTGMRVRFEPGKPVVLSSLWVGLGGMIITFVGRMRKSRGAGTSS